MSDPVGLQRGVVICGADDAASEEHKMKEKCDWEECKENYQPVKTGRKPEVLTTFANRSAKGVLQPKGIEIDRQRFVDAINEYQGDDPLEGWLDYIRWTKDTFVSGGQKSELVPLLEKCTRAFHDSEQYRNDIRYLRVWIQYVRVECHILRMS
jgi:checkpoint serine/threonine-protein kinase